MKILVAFAIVILVGILSAVHILRSGIKTMDIQSIHIIQALKKGEK
jgi:hypothetical protein